ncbi:hypothetical protein QBC44DRAFT_368991 [Cladorrhinum sp. PSN332]|nr:hypothetical protein QBC44DRAFT_368991 [Cladorrhinum sp. PSN332]
MATTTMTTTASSESRLWLAPPRTPLTTTFTPPTTCFDGMPTEAAGTLRYADVVTGIRPEVTPAYECYPSQFQTVIYSPGICPSGFKAFKWERELDENTIRFIANNDDDARGADFEPARGSCTKLVARRLKAGGPTYLHNTTTLTYLTYDAALSSYITTSHDLATTSHTIFHPRITVMWREGDFPEGQFPLPPIAPTSTSSTRRLRLWTATRPTSTDTSTKSQSDDTSSNSTSKAPMAAGIVVAGILFFTVMVPVLIHATSYVRRRQRQRHSDSRQEASGLEVECQGTCGIELREQDPDYVRAI